MSSMELKYSDLDRLIGYMQDYPGNTEKAITDYLHGGGYDFLEQGIQRLIPVSDSLSRHARNPKKGPPQPMVHAKFGNALRDKDKNSNLSVTISNQKNFSYLYFPDDGSNTVRHQGNQKFFKKGVEEEKGNVIDGIIDQLRFNFKEG